MTRKLYIYISGDFVASNNTTKRALDAFELFPSLFAQIVPQFEIDPQYLQLVDILSQK